MKLGPPLVNRGRPRLGGRRTPSPGAVSGAKTFVRLRVGPGLPHGDGMLTSLSHAKFAYTTRNVDRSRITGLLTGPRSPPFNEDFV